MTFFIEKNQKDLVDFWRRKLTLKVKIWHFLTPSHQTNSQNWMISFDYIQLIFWTKTFPIFYPSLENSTTSITIHFTIHWFFNSCKSQTNLNWLTSHDFTRIEIKISGKICGFTMYIYLQVRSVSPTPYIIWSTMH